MKKLLLSAFLIGSMSIQAQTVLERVGLGDGALLRNKVIDYKDGTIQGSPYLTSNFFYGEIEGIDGGLMMRYNAHRDEFEIKKTDQEKDLFSLPKEDRYGLIIGKFNNTIIRLKEYKDKTGDVVKGYLYELHKNGNISLLKREKIILQKEREGTGYQDYQPPKFSKGRTELYLEKGDGSIIEFPTNKKELLKIYPDKKNEIEAFLKSNKIKFNDESDMALIVDFIGKL